MNFTDLFIRKPVLAMTISLLILVLGVRSLTSLAVRQYPKTQNAVVTISTTYYGADAQTVAGFITQPLEGAIYAETIPFAETRDYVKKVMTNSVYYSALFEEKPQTLKSRLGIVQPASSADKTADKDKVDDTDEAAP